MRARPVPGVETGLQRLRPAIVIEIGLAAPADAGRGHLHLDPRARGKAVPDVVLMGIEREGRAVQGLGIDPHRACHLALPRHEQARVAFMDVDGERPVLPAYRARPDPEVRGIALHRAAAPLGHRPARLRAVERDIERGMIERIAPPAALVIGREHAPEERDDRQPVLPVVADRVDIPPGIAARGDSFVEARSFAITRAASCPDKAAMGTPAAGWVAPPVQ